jgi:hypothetical protein
VKKNTNTIADGYSSLTDCYQTASVTVMEQLAVNDTISVSARSSMHVYGGIESCLTILQEFLIESLLCIPLAIFTSVNCITPFVS